ncbi:MAG TPA: 8-amino-7-oxononanoate synthase [Chitinophagales bacterium]|nr:8-amino-7-oxononanoate synthase [Chitinophagales bacterium]
MEKVHERLQRELQTREEQHALRKLSVTDDLIDLASNDYLGFAKDAQLRAMIDEEVKSLPFVGSGGSRLLTGNNAYVELVEKEICEFHQSDAALFFNSGYEANSGLISCVVHRHDIILYDELIHASLREGIKLSNAKAYAFLHNDIHDLKAKLEMHKGNVFIITESVFSMDGDLCPLIEIIEIAEQFQAAIILDEAHATGVIGERGEGLAQYLGVQDSIFARVHTFGKAIGANGAVILGSLILRDYLINFCKPFIYTTAPNYLQLAAVRMAYRFLREDTMPLQHLRANLELMKSLLEMSNFRKSVSTNSAIFSFVVPGNDRVKSLAAAMRSNGFDMRPILTPTVPAGMERIRICVHAFNTHPEIEGAIRILASNMPN